jgi:hypothetical protein
MEYKELDVAEVIELAKETLIKTGSIAPHLFGLAPDGADGIYMELAFDDDEAKFKSLIKGGLAYGAREVPEFYFVSEAYMQRVPVDGTDPYPALSPSEVPLDDRIEALIVVRIRAGAEIEARVFTVEIKREGRDRDRIRFLETKGLHGASAISGRISQTLITAYKAGRAAAETNKRKGF